MCNPFVGEYAHEDALLRNHYHCRECEYEWHSEWFAAVDESCPDCQADITPFDSETLLVNADAEPTSAASGAHAATSSGSMLRDSKHY